MRVKGYIDLYEHQLPFDLDFNLDEPSVHDCLEMRDDDGSKLTDEEVVAEYLGNYIHAVFVVEEFEWSMASVR